MKIISVSSAKGGVGKSSLTIHTSNFLVSQGNRVLVIDLDSNNSVSFNYFYEEDNRSIARAFFESNIIPNIIPISDKLSLVQSSLQLMTMQSVSIHALKRLLEPIKNDFDWVIIDTAPYINNIVLGAYIAADLIITPVVTECLFDIKTALYLKDRITCEVPDCINKWWLIFNRFRSSYSHTKSVQDYKNAFLEQFDNFLKTIIPETKLISKSIDSELAIKNNKTWNLLYSTFNHLYQEIDLLTSPVFDEAMVV